MRAIFLSLLATLVLTACSGAPEPEAPASHAAKRPARALALAPEIPVFVSATSTLTIPDLNYAGQRMGPAVLQHIGQYRFTVVQMPEPLGAAGMSASSFEDGKLRMASVRVDGHRYANVVLQLGADGVFSLVAASDPMPVAATSYENKNNIPFDATQLPTVRALGIPPALPGEQDSNERSVAFADFFQEGRFSAFVQVNRAMNLWGLSFLSDSPGTAYFLAQDESGQWQDRTAELLPHAEDRSVCVSASYSSVADFNNDGKPDVFVSCNGIDYDLGITDPEQQRQVYLSNQMLFASQPDGTYRRIVVPHFIYGHKAAAADIDGDGNIDILTTNQGIGTDEADRKPFVLLGNGDGTFVRDDTIVPANIFDLTGQMFGLYQVWLVPVESRIDAVFASSGRTIRLPGNGKGGFDTAGVVTFASAQSAAYGKDYEMPLDAVYDSARERFYFLSTASHSTGTEWAVLSYGLSGQLAGISQPWDNITATLQPYSGQFKPTADGYLVAYTGGCPVTPSGLCLMHVAR